MLASLAVGRLRSMHRRSKRKKNGSILLFSRQQLREYATRVSHYQKDEGAWYTQLSDNFKLDPSGRIRIAWDITMLVLLSYLVVMTPYRLGFDDDPEYNSPVWVLEKAMEYYFICDLFVNFRTGYFDSHGSLEMRSSRIAKNYITGFFIIDLVSSIPFDDLFGSLGGADLQSAKVLKAGKVARVSRLLKIAKLARLLKLQVYLERFEDEINISANKIKLLSLLLVTFLIAHWNACGWSYMSRITDQFYQTSWQLHYQVLDNVGSEYIAALYWSITTMTTVGYGDIVPQSDEERVYAIISMVASGGFYGFVIATLSSLVTHTDANKRMTIEKMEAIILYMKLRSFPKVLFKKVKRFYKHYYERKTALNEGTILHELSPHLRHEVALFLIDKTVSHIKLFQKLNPHSYSKLITILNPVRVDPGEWLVKTGEPGAEMYILIAGTLEVLADDKTKVSVLKSGSYFGELCALGISMHRTCGVKAKTACELYTLSREDLMQAFVHDEPQAIVDMIETTLELYDDVASGRTKVTVMEESANGQGRRSSYAISAAQAADPEYRKQVIERAMNSIVAPRNTTHNPLKREKSRKSLSMVSSPGYQIASEAIEKAIQMKETETTLSITTEDEAELTDPCPVSSPKGANNINRNRQSLRLSSIESNEVSRTGSLTSPISGNGGSTSPSSKMGRSSLRSSLPALPSTLPATKSEVQMVHNQVEQLEKKMESAMTALLTAIQTHDVSASNHTDNTGDSDTDGIAGLSIGNRGGPIDIQAIAKRVKERKVARQKDAANRRVIRENKESASPLALTRRRARGPPRTGGAQGGGMLSRMKSAAFSVKHSISNSSVNTSAISPIADDE